MGKITIQRIAKELGFSRNTVSMALKGNDMVAPQTREMIVKYAQSLGYSRLGVPDGEPEENERDTVYRIMILRKADVAVYWDKVISGISEEASRHNCQTQVAVVTRQDEEALRLPLGLNEEIHAVFSVNLLDVDYIRRIREKGIQVYLLDNYTEENDPPPGDVVKMESFHATARLTRHLIGQGMKRIGFLNENSSVYESMRDRFEGYHYAMRRSGLEIDPSIVFPDAQNGNFYDPATFDGIVESYQNLPEAVVCGNDSIAKFLTQALRAKGIRVPEDVAVTGFDNDEEGMLDPFFTTVNVDAKWLGRRMVQCFLHRLAYPGAPYEKVMVFGEVILRKSSRR